MWDAGLLYFLSHQIHLDSAVHKFRRLRLEVFPKRGIIPLVKEYPALQFPILDHGLSAPARRV